MTFVQNEVASITLVVLFCSDCFLAILAGGDYQSRDHVGRFVNVKATFELQVL